MQKYKEFFEYLNLNIDKKILTVTPTNRLARHLRHEFDLINQEKRLNAWEVIEIYSFSEWQIKLWQDFRLKSNKVLPILMNQAQENFLWQEAVQKIGKINFFGGDRAFAEIAKQAWKTLSLWQVSINSLENYHHAECQYFLELANIFFAKKEQLYLITEAEILNYLAKDKDALPDNLEEIILIGFDEFPPAFLNLLDFFAKHKINNIKIEYKLHANITSYAYPNYEQELRAATRYAKNCVAKNEYPVGIIVPNLTQNRNELERILISELAPEKLLEPNYTDLPFTLSGGTSLADCPVISCALDLTKILFSSLTLDEISNILLSPYYLSGITELPLRAKFDAFLRNNSVNKLNLTELLKLFLIFSQNNSLPNTKILLEKLNFWQKQIDGNYLPSTWLLIYNDILESLSWPGEESVDSYSYQAIDQWHKVMQQFVYFDIFNIKKSFASNFSLLYELTREILFQVEAEDKPIQVLGMLEAGGIQFQHLWLTGMADTILPAPANPNPLLPIELQKKLNMPHASGEREYNFALQLYNRFTNSANILINSYAKCLDDNVVTPSALIKEKPIIDASINLEDLKYKADSFELFHDNKGNIYNQNYLFKAAMTLKEQAACPFKAYAKLRLHAESFPEISHGLTSLDRGIITHRALEFFWQDTKTQANLLRLSNEALASKLEDIVNLAINEYQKNSLSEFGKNTILLEQERVINLLTQWLILEKQRKPFQVVALEKKIQIKLDKVIANFRVDRIDYINGLGYALLDYKTSSRKITEWLGERPDDLQLPIYQLGINFPVIAIAFAEVVSENCKFSGIANNSDVLPGIKDIKDENRYFANITWDEQKASWQQITDALIKNHLNGIAIADPKKGSLTCRNCDLQGLCRISEVLAC